MLMNSMERIEKFENDMNGLIEDLHEINSFFIIYNYLYSQTTNEEDIKVMNKAPAFFGITMKSLQQSGFMGLSRIFESGRRSDKNIFKFLGFLEANHKYIFKENTVVNHLTIQEDKKKLDEVKDIIDNLITWRDKIIAHNDKIYFKKEGLLSEQYPIEHNNIKMLIDLGAEILNKYQSAYNDKHTVMEVLNVYDVKKVIQALKLY